MLKFFYNNATSTQETGTPELTDFLEKTNNTKDRYTVIHYKNDEKTKVEIGDFYHDIKAALRTFNYLADKVAEGYDLENPKDQKKMNSIRNHLKKMEEVNTNVLDKLFPL